MICLIIFNFVTYTKIIKEEEAILDILSVIKN